MFFSATLLSGESDSTENNRLHFPRRWCIIYHVSGCGPVGSAPALGQNTERCRRQSKRGVLWAAVDKIEDQRKPDDFIGYRNPGDRSNSSVSRSFHFIFHLSGCSAVGSAPALGAGTPKRFDFLKCCILPFIFANPPDYFH